MTENIRRIPNLKGRRHARPPLLRRTWVPSMGCLILAVLLVVALSPQVVRAPGANVLVGPGGIRLPIQRTSDNLGSFQPYSPGELWGGGNMVEQCLPCNLETASGKPAGQSIQPGQQVNPATGDFTYSDTLFSLPAAEPGAPTGIRLVYDSEAAGEIIGCSLPFSTGCANASTAFPNFGFGWEADEFPTMVAYTSASTQYYQINEPNGAEATFQDIGSSTTCPVNDSSSSANYTVPAGPWTLASTDNFCAPYRVDGQMGIEPSEDFDVFEAHGGKQSVVFSEYGMPMYLGNAVTQGVMDYVLDDAPGTSGCPRSVSTGYVVNCDLVNNGSAITIVVTGTPTGNSMYNTNVLKVIDPANAQPYNITWEPSDGIEPIDEPAKIQNGQDSTSATTYHWTQYDDMIYDGTGLAGDVGQTVNYNSEGLVSSTTDQLYANTTTYSYLNTTCYTCLTTTQTTTVSYPDGETDVDNYNEGVLLNDTFGGVSSGQQEVTYGVSYPLSTNQDGPITETFNGPASNQTTTALTDGVGNITQLTDAEGNVFSSFYDTPNNTNNFAAINSDELCWTAPGPATGSYTDPPYSCTSTPSDATVYGYDSYGNPTSVTDPLGTSTTHYGYYTSFLVCWVAPPTVNASSGGPCSSTSSPPTQAPVGSTAYQYDYYGDIACQFVAYGETDQTTTAATYDEDGEMTASYPPDAFGLGTSKACTNPTTSYGTSYQYTAGDMTKETAPNGLVTTTTYDDGLPDRVVDPTGKTITAYDADGRPCWTSRLSPTGSPGTPPYSCASQPTGSEMSYSYLDDTDAPTTVTDPAGNVTTTSYTNPAYPTSPTTVTDEAAEAIVYDTYDANGNLCVTGTVQEASCGWQTGDTGDTWDTFDTYGDVLTSTDANGNETQYGYGNAAFPQLVQKVTDAGGSFWQYAYDSDGRLTQSTDPSDNMVTTGYDLDSRKCYQEAGTASFTCSSSPGAGASAWTYNLNSTLATMSDNLASSPATTSYTYDADGNQTSIDDDNGNTVNYTYNVSDQVSCIGYPGASKLGANCGGTASASNPFVNYAYAPANNRLSSTTDWLGHTTSYGYSSDGLNNLTSISYPTTTSSDSVNYGYNADSQVSSQSYGGTALSSVPNQSWGYNDDDLVNSATQLDGTTSSYTSSPTYKTPDTTLDHNWIQENTNPGASGADTYAYNPNGELASDTPPSSSANSYGYNTDDEMCWSASGTSSNACLSPPTGAGTSTYTSTADGQRCWSSPSSIQNALCTAPPSGSTGYAWNSYGELCWSGTTSTSPLCGSPPSGVTKYSYDGNGNRISETSPSGGTQDFTWDSSSSIPLLLQDGTNAYVYGPELFGGTAPVEQINLSTGVASYLASARSGVQLVLSQSGSITNESSYSTYGAQSNSTSPATPFGFSGGYTDPTGLIFLIHRYYDPSTHEFISIDPDAASTGQPYLYSGDNPVNSNDPSGLFFTGDDGETCGVDSGGSSVCNSENGATQGTDDQNSQEDIDAEIGAFLILWSNYMVGLYLQAMHTWGEEEALVHATPAAYASSAEAVTEGGSGETYQQVFMNTDVGPLVNVPDVNSNPLSGIAHYISHLNPWEVADCADAALETAGAFGVSTLVTVSGLTAEGATAGTSTVAVISGVQMYIGSSALGYAAYQVCSSAFG